MNNLILAVIVGFLFTSTDFNSQKKPPLLDNRLFKPPRIVDSQKVQTLILLIYKKKKIDPPIKGKCTADFLSSFATPKNSKYQGNVFLRRGLSEKEAGRSLSATEKNDMHNLFLFFNENEESADKKERCSEFKGSLNYSVPADLKGDFARACFYMSVQYRIPLPDDWEDVLRMWHVMDPPSISEMEGNSYIEEVQKNRNPFIDYPELAERVVNF